MTSKWTQATLGSIAIREGYGLVDGPFGSNLPASLYKDEGVPVIRGSNLALGASRFRAQEFVYVSWDTANRLARSLCQPLDIIFTKKGTLGQTGLIPEGGEYDQYLLSSNQMKLTVDSLVADPLFVYYFVSSPESTKKIIQDSEATGVPKTNVKYLREFPITLPPLSEQRAIANFLGILDDKIELNQRMNETLEAMVQAIFKDWFIEFGPIRTKAEIRAPYLAPELWELFPSGFDEEGKPIGWKKKTLGDLCEVAIGGLWGKDKLETGAVVEYNCLRGVDLKQLRELGEAPNVPLRFAKKSLIKKRSVSDYDVLIASSGIGPCGRTLWIGIDDYFNSCKSSKQTIYSNFVKRLHCVSPSVACFLDRHLNEMRANGEIQKYISGTSVPNLNDKGLLHSHQIILPSESLLDAFFEFALIVQRQLFSGENATLAQTRDVLLPKLMSGEIRLSDAEKVVEAVA